MGKERLKALGRWVFFGACGLVVLVLLLFVGPKAHKAKTPHADAPQPTRSTSAPAATPTPTAKPIHPLLKVDDALVGRLQTFVEAYYFVKPDDSAFTRQSRLPPFVKAPLDLQIRMDVRQDKLRLTQHLTIRGQLLPSTITAVADPQNSRQLSLSAKVLVNLYNPLTGAAYSDQPAEEGVATVWQKNARGQWELLRFVEGGDKG